MLTRSQQATAALVAIPVLLLGLAAAAWWHWRGTGEAPSHATIGSEQPFALAECRARLFDGSPAVAVMFTQPLSRRQDFAAQARAFEIDAKGNASPQPPRWVLGDNPRVLYLPYAKPEHSYRIELAAGLAAGNATLGTAQSCTAKSEAMPVSYYFASRGVVLPAGQSGGLPVVTVNTPEVDVQFLRVGEQALPAFLEQVGGRRVQRKGDGATNATSARDEYDDDGDYNDPARRLKGSVSGYALDDLRERATSVYLGRFATDARPNRRNVSFLPVERIKELQEPGIYVAVMNPPGRFNQDYQVTYFYVTDIGLHVRRHAAQTDVFATSLKSGTALRGVEVSLLDERGKSLAQVRTDAEGHAVFEGASEHARTVLARQGKALSLVALRDAALDLSEFDVGGHPSRSRKLFVHAGRDLYRPGEQFSVSILARDADGRPLAWPTPVPTPAPASAAQPAAAGLPPLTLTLKRPGGEIEWTQLAHAHALGTAYYQHALTLPAAAATGRWLLEVRTDPAAKRADAQWSFQVEEFLPERMKLALQAPEAVLTGAARMAVAVQGDYLYGAPAAGNRLLGSVVLQRERFALPQALPGFIFGDVADDKERTQRELPEVALDDAGHAVVEAGADAAARRSPMKLRASFSLLESGGRPVVRTIERAWWPAPVLVGLRPLFERDVAPEGGLAGFEITRVDAQGKFVPTTGTGAGKGTDLQVRLVREERRWYWRYDDNRGWHSGFDEEEELVEARTLPLAARGKFDLPVRWGRYRLEVIDPETQHTSRYRFYAGWGAQDAEDMGNRPDRVHLKLEGAPFKAGAVARLTVTPPHDGEALVTVEGDRVLYQRRVAVRTGGTVVEIPIPAQDARWARHDLYVAVVAFRPGSQGDRITPSRALGLVHLPLARTERRLKLALSAPAKATPEHGVPVTLRLSGADGKPLPAGPAMVTLWAVDVGILNITRYATPDPADYFFGKHRYGADMLDAYGRLIEKMDGNVAKQRFGGDAGKRDTQSLPRKVRLVDIFSGPVALDARGQATITLPLPDFNGSLRLMAVASTPDSYANAQAEMTVAAPLVAEIALPRFITPGDRATVALDLTNLSGAEQTVGVKIESGAALKLSAPRPALPAAPRGGSSKVAEPHLLETGQQTPIKLADKQRRVLSYTLQAGGALGLAPIKLTVSAGKLKIVRQAALQVQPATPLQREAKRQRLDPGASVRLDATLADALWPASAELTLTLHNQPPIDVRDAVQGLLGYPYGCLEQTTSSAYPLVFIDEDAAKAVGLTPLPREERARRLDQAFSRLAGMQQPQGGFGLWSASGPHEAWLSAYVAGFLQDARGAGFAVPEALRTRAMAALLEQFQRSAAAQSPPAKAPTRAASAASQTRGRVADAREVQLLRIAHQRLAEAAHAGYVLAREQRAPLATLRTLHDSYRSNARSPLVGVHLGLALRLMGDEARAKVALAEAVRLPWGINPASEHNAWGDEWLGDYGSRLRDLALAYALLHRHQAAPPGREDLLLDLAAQFDHHRYLSTQERLALLLAARAAGTGSEQAWRAQLRLGATRETLSAKVSQQRHFDAGTLKRGVVVTNQGAEPLFLEVAVQGYPLVPPPPRSDRIAIERSWWTTRGEPVTTREFKSGDTLIVRLSVAARQRIKDALVVDRIAAGLEVENLNLSQGAGPGAFTVQGVEIAQAMADDDRIKHTEYRDDRFVAAADLDGRPLNLYYLVRVVTPGRYGVPAPLAEDMYRPDLRGVGQPEPDITVLDAARKGP